MKKFLALIQCTLIACTVLVAQEQQLTLADIFTNYEYGARYSGQKRWIDDGDGYTVLERGENGVSIVRYTTSSGKREVLLAAKDLIPAGSQTPLAIHNYEWSHDKSMLLIYTNSKRVWRINSRGDYWIKNLKTGSLTQLGKSLPESSLMFAKFSPDDKQVAYVSKNNLYVEPVAGGNITVLTNDGAEKVINGTFDWAYEEEFGCRDGFRWSPDSKQIAYWHLEADGIRDFLMINNTDSLYPFTVPIQYPKVGTTSSACKVGVVNLRSKSTTWMKVPGDQRDNYIPRMEWADNSNELIIQQLNRAQNTNKVMLANANSGNINNIYTDKDAAWLDVVDDLLFFKDGQSFTWISQKDGWNSVYEISRDGQSENLMTPGTFDVINIALIDLKKGWMYYLASPENATQRYLYRNPIDQPEKATRLTPKNQPGSHSYDISPDGKWAFHTLF
jgi:dipeptidyl-peptidase-4